MFLLLYCLTFDFSTPLNLQIPSLRPQAGFGLASSHSLPGSSIPVSLMLSAVGTSNSAGVACSARLPCCWILRLQSYQSNLLLTAQRVPGTHILAPDVVSSRSSYSFTCADTNKASTSLNKSTRKVVVFISLEADYPASGWEVQGLSP